MKFDYIIVGAGFAGATLAERLARGLNKKILLIDKRAHIGGNAYDCLDAAGVLIHKYGPHIFHTNCERIFEYLSQFTSWRKYEHKVLGYVDNKLLPIPINLTTLNQLYKLNMTSAEAEIFLKSKAEPIEKIMTSADVVISKIGTELYEKFFRGYTRKQWGLDPSELDKSVTSRVPTRTNNDDRYFTDAIQYMPRDGYTKMFEKMLDHPNITIKLNTDYKDIKGKFEYDELVYTGPIDEYFGYCYGKLPYRSLKFVHKTMDMEVYQPVAVVNYPSEDVEYTRITEYKHLTGQSHPKTSLTWEFPAEEGDPFYPIPRAENQTLYKKYEALANVTPNVTFIGRLGSYRYYNMDQIVGQALATYNRIVSKIDHPVHELSTGT
ncbi:MAG: UDP-galactopyranose mutase [Burkholderiales bacterium]|nr:UDP-galactopyranose mutase [Burkholderiales bacterium]